MRFLQSTVGGVRDGVDLSQARKTHQHQQSD